MTHRNQPRIVAFPSHRLVSVLTATLALATFAGCKKGDKSGSDTKGADKGAETKGAAPKVAGGGTCPAGATKVEAGEFCAVMPADYKARPEHKIGSDQVDYEYRDANNNNGVTFTVRNYSESYWDMSVKMTKEGSEAVKGTSAEIPGGTYWLYDDKENIWGKSWTHGAAKTIECITRMNSKSSDPDKDKVLAICKSVTPL